MASLISKESCSNINQNTSDLFMVKVIIIQKCYAVKAMDHLPSASVISELLTTKCNLLFMHVQLLLGKPTKSNHFIKHLKQGPCSCYNCSNDITN